MIPLMTESICSSLVSIVTQVDYITSNKRIDGSVSIEKELLSSSSSRAPVIERGTREVKVISEWKNSSSEAMTLGVYLKNVGTLIEASLLSE